MFTISQFRTKFSDARRQRAISGLVKPGLRSRIDAQTIGFAAGEPVTSVLDDGTLVLYDGAELKSGTDPLQELKPRAGYRIWERMSTAVQA